MTIYYLLQVGSDGGRHGWFKWADGPSPTGTSMTQSITLYDCMLLSMQSMVGTPDYSWCEPKPCSDKMTRVLGLYFLLWVYVLTSFLIAVIMADEGEKFLEKAVIWLQGQQEKLTDGFSIQFQGQEYSFVVDYIDRYRELDYI